MKLSGLLRMASLLLIAMSPFVSSQHIASSIGDTVDTLEDNNDHNRVLKPLTKKIKSQKTKEKSIKNKKAKNKKGKKVSKSSKGQDPACDEIEALEKENKIQCASDCSDNYLTCEKGLVVEKALGLGERCYKNESVRTSEGKCVLRDMEDMVLSFKVMDACPNYPELDQCSTTVEEGGASYTGVRNVDGIYYWIDDVIVAYFATDDIEGSGEKGFKIYYTIRFGHDKEANRTVTYVASMNFGTTEVIQWRSADNIDGVERLEYNCVNAPPSPVTIFVEKIVTTNPALIGINEEGEIQLLNIEGNNFYTSEVQVEAEEIGEDYLEMMRNKTEDGVFDTKTIVSALAENLGNSSEDLCAFDNDLCEEELQSDAVSRPAFMYNDVFIFSTTDFSESGYDFSPDIENGFDEAKIPQIQGVIADVVDKRLCQKIWEQDYESGGCDIATPIFPRGQLGKIFPRTTDSLLLPEYLDLVELDAARRRMEFNETKTEWTKKNREDFIGDAFKKLPNKLQLIGNFSSNLDDELKQKFLDLALGEGDGLPDSQLLLETFEEIDRLLLRIYNITDKFEDNLIEIFDLINNVESIRPIVNDLEILSKIVYYVLQAASAIPKIGTFIVPVRNVVGRFKSLLKTANTKLENIEAETTVPARPKIEIFLNKTESTQEVIAKTVFVNQALSSVVQITRNCPSVDSKAKIVNDAIASGKDVVTTAIDDFAAFGESVVRLISLIVDPISIFNTLSDDLRKLAEELRIFDVVLVPIRNLLNKRISVSIPGPFCTTRKILNIPYPCGVRFCRSCSFFGCFNYPCGVNICTKRTVIYLPRWCSIGASFTVGEIVDGITGVLDILFKPLIFLMEQAIKLLGIDFGSFGIPGIDISFNGLSLPSIDLNLPSVDLNLPSPFPEISGLSIDFANAIDIGNFNASFLVPSIGKIPGFEQFQPICASTDFNED